MEASNPHNQGYWFVLREDQGNVILSSNNIATIQTHNIQPEQDQPRYIIDNGPRSYTQVAEAPPIQEDSESTEQAAETWHKSITEDLKVWDRSKVKLLLTICLEHKHVEKDILWEEIGRALRVSPEQCHMKYMQLRRTFLRQLKRKTMGKQIKWVHYNLCEQVFYDLKSCDLTIQQPWDESRVKKLLNLYIEYMPRFRKPDCLQRDLWKEIGDQLGTTGYNCYHKFKNLKRTYLKWMNKCHGKGVKWMYHQFFEKIYYNCNPASSRAWNRQKTKQLLDSYTQIAHKFRNPKIQKKELWTEISRQVGETPDACDKKFRNLKQTFVRLKMKANCGKPTTKWRYYRDFEAIYHNATRYLEIDGTQKLVCSSIQEDNYIKQLLEFYLKHKDKFRDPLVKNRTLWRMIAPKLGMSPDECDKKFRNLKQTYVRLASKGDQSRMCSRWPYFSYFTKIYEGCSSQGRRSTGETAAEGAGAGCPQPALCDAVREMHERRETHRRFERLVTLAAESNQLQRERNQILLALLNRT